MRQSLEERFLDKVSPEPNSGCWLWIGVIGTNGYGQLRAGPRHHLTGAHRVAYRLYRGPIPTKLQLDHLCRVRSCVNPDHLEIVTQRINIQRGRNRNREKSHCPRGHPLVGMNLEERTDRLGRRHRRCHICHLRDSVLQRKKLKARED